MSNDAVPDQLSSSTPIRGCLVGIVIAVVFLIISGVFYFIAAGLGTSRSLALLIGIVSGPLVGGGIVVLMLLNGWLVRLLGFQPVDRDSDHES